MLRAWVGEDGTVGVEARRGSESGGGFSPGGQRKLTIRQSRG